MSFIPLLRMIAFLYWMLWSVVASAEIAEADIQALFPKLTRVGGALQNPHVIPVYQLDQLLGYVFETNDLTDLPGFSGERINLLIGLDAAGQLVKLKVLNHHEPIFLHGLGERPMIEFLNQYEGITVDKRVIVDSRHSGQEQAGSSTVYIDGVTKATVSVLVMNDTVLSAALQVARAYLEGFTRPPSVRVREDVYQPYDWQALLESGLVRRWTVSQADMQTQFPLDLQDYADAELQHALEQSAPLGEYFYAYLNTPVTGKNLLGEQDYARLKQALRPGEHALLVVATGDYGFLEPAFRRGTVPSRLGMSQNGLPVDIRGLDFFDNSAPQLPADAPPLMQQGVFRIKAQSGFDPSQPMTLTLNLDLARNHLIRDQGELSDSYQLPAELFDIQAVTDVKPLPLWQRLWLDRWLQISGLVLILLVVSAAFIWQHRLSSQRRLLHRVRWSVMLLTLFFIGFYAQGQLSVVNIYTLLLQLIKGFDIEVFLLDPVLFVLWTYVFISLFLWGRGVFCGWLCPFGVLQEMASKLGGWLKLKQVKIPAKLHQRLQKLKYLLLVALVASAFYSVSLAERLAELEPFKTAVTLVFVRSWPFVVYALLLLGVGMVIHKFFCRYLCPLGAGLAVLGKFSLFRWLHRRTECGSPCQLCRVRCEIDSINRDGSIDYNECVQCMECIVILNNEDQCAIELSQAKRRKKATADNRIVVQQV
ncbi:4Fe-4S binding protein [Amphritea sp. 1_MG-2023]|uniref:NosR/NirI family protein n=1 Tax=Amphritea sp. 1_MG-2023 TaxID=3062670 RepID=UPI0026E12ECF|nr:NosR/NirI family protein [Amphritea sp. 1_MG-2023]MDO6563806.1 4Fe-4S binding protein [Amphritea sp. 1_MG-2023]